MEMQITKNSTLYLSDILSSKNISKIVLTENVNVDLVDDVNGEIKLEIILNKNSFLSYNMKILNNDNNISRDLIFRFIGTGAMGKVKCLLSGQNGNVHRVKTTLHHKASDTSSDLVIKGVLFDGARLFCDNLIRVEEGVKRIKAQEQNKNLLIGDDARVITIPKLEVHADEVSCQHGATVSCLSDEHLFYLQSRGMDLNCAKKLLIKAFLN